MAYEFYMSIKGAKQGDFKGESPRKGQEKKMPCFAFFSGITSPRDAASGNATGKRQHSPLVVRKVVGAATPQIVNALCTNETLNTVKIEFYESDTSSAAPRVMFIVTLSKAQVSKHSIIQNVAPTGSTTPDAVLHEEIQFTFDKIEWSHEVAKTMTADSWSDSAG